MKLLGAPTEVFRRLQEHSDELFREVSLGGAAELPDDLVEEIRRMEDGFRDVVGPIRRPLIAARSRGEEEVDVDVWLTAAQVRHLRQLHEVLCRVDESCRAGLLLSLPLDGEAASLRAWIVEEGERQVLDGRAARPWSVYAELAGPFA